MSDVLTADPVPPRVRDILNLFAGELAEQRFGELDAHALETLAEQTRACAKEVERARAVLDEALTALEASRAALTLRAEQGLEYARIFARENPALSARLGALIEETSSRGKKRRKPKSDGPKKAPPRSPEVAELPFGERTRGGPSALEA